MSSGSKGGGHWRKNQGADIYVQRARAEGWRSRAVFKLEEIDRKQQLFKRGMTVIDLGAAPGGWCQYATSRLKGTGRVIGLDLLEIEPLENVELIQGDFREEAILQQLMDCLDGARVDLVMSDLAPNISGVRGVDQPRSMELAELARELAGTVLGPGGSLIIKLFHGEGFDDFVRETRAQYGRVSVKKPAASRTSSRETYLVARNYKL